MGKARPRFDPIIAFSSANFDRTSTRASRTPEIRYSLLNMDAQLNYEALQDDYYCSWNL